MSVTHQDEHRAQLSRALVRTAAGDRRALEEVYNHTSAKLFDLCLRILSDRSQAEDVLQEVYLTVCRKADQFDADRASPITWLSTLVIPTDRFGLTSSANLSVSAELLGGSCTGAPTGPVVAADQLTPL